MYSKHTISIHKIVKKYYNDEHSPLTAKGEMTAWEMLRTFSFSICRGTTLS